MPRRFRSLAVPAACLVLVTVRTAAAGILPDITTGDITIRLESVASGISGPFDGVEQSFPTDLAAFPDGTGRMAVATLGGIVRVIDGQDLVAAPFLNTVVPDTETATVYGMTGIAFHPDYATAASAGFGRFYTLTTERAGAGTPDFAGSVTIGSGMHDGVLTEWTDNNVGDNQLSGTSRELFRIAQPDGSHNLNDLAFDDAGLLYVSVGDGGFRNDVATQQSVIFGDNASNLTNVFGKILRIDPSEPAPGDPLASENGQYRIPAGQALEGALPEIYSFGHRNPYRLGFDRATGDLYVGDVGQFQIEEIDRVVAGANYGWPNKEGTFLFDRTNGAAVQPDLDSNNNGLGDVAESLGLTDPILQYDHSEGASVTGGFVYRGSAIPELVGKYVYGDLVGGQGILYGDLATGQSRRLRIEAGSAPLLGQLISIGEDEDGEIYLLGNSGQDGRVLRIAPAADPPAPQPLFDETGPLAAPADGDVFLFLDDLGGTQDSRFVAVNTGITMTAGSTYEIVAATGHANGAVLANQSIQAWRTPDGSIGSREFIGQSFSQSAGWNDAPEGEWIDNGFEFTASADEQGDELIILVTNFSLESQPGSSNPTDTGIAYWDNFRVFVDDALMFVDSFEIGLAAGTEAEVTDAGWHLGNATLAGSGVARSVDRLPGDFDKDGDVDGDDFLVWQANFGTVGTATANDGDADRDGDVDGDDFLAWQAAFEPATDSEVRHLPEPSAAMILLGALAVVAISTARRASPPATSPTRRG